MRKQFIWIQNIIKCESHKIRKTLITISKMPLTHFSIMKASLGPHVSDSTAMMFFTREFIIWVVRFIGDLCYFFFILISQIRPCG